MKEFNPEYLDRLKYIISEHDEAEARKELADLHPADIAELYQDLDLEEAEFLYRLLAMKPRPMCSWSLTRTTVTSC